MIKPGLYYISNNKFRKDNSKNFPHGLVKINLSSTFVELENLLVGDGHFDWFIPCQAYKYLDKYQLVELSEAEKTIVDIIL